MMKLFLTLIASFAAVLFTQQFNPQNMQVDVRLFQAPYYQSISGGVQAGQLECRGLEAGVPIASIRHFENPFVAQSMQLVFFAGFGCKGQIIARLIGDFPALNPPFTAASVAIIPSRLM
jgi:hypothetical protein